MAIVPSGKRKIMVAQHGSFGQQDFSNSQLDNLNLNKPMVPPQEDSDTSSFLPKNFFDEKTDDTSQMDITEFIFKTLEGFGYPPRRLEQFENKFVDEKLYPGGLREISITLPDRYYSERKRLKDTDISKIVQEMQTTFQLNFVDAERKDKNIKMNFTSQSQKEEGEEGEVDMAGDVLDDVYGGGETASRKKKSKKAQTINELVKSNKDVIYNLMLSLLKNGE